MSADLKKDLELNKSGRETALIDWLRFTCLWDFNLNVGSTGRYVVDLDTSSIVWEVVLKKLPPVFIFSDADRKTLDKEEEDDSDSHLDTVALLDLLKVDPYKLTDNGHNELGALGYEKTIVFGSDVRIGVNPQRNAVVDGVASQFIIDLSGSACRSFEARGGDWKSLIAWLVDHSVRFNRIDLAMDSIDGGIDIVEIKDKITRQEFTSVFRAPYENGKLVSEVYRLSAPDEDDLAEYGGRDPLIYDTRQGYTATFGNRSSMVMLNIYDKKAERKTKGHVSTAEKWVRFEASFTRSKCESVVRNLIAPSFSSDGFGKVVAGIIHGLIEFKDVGKKTRFNDKNNHLNRCPIWKPYDRFLGGVEKVKVPSNQAKVEQSVERSSRWLNEYVSRANITAWACARSVESKFNRSSKMRIAQEGISEKMVQMWVEFNRKTYGSASVESVLNSIQLHSDMWDDEQSDFKPITLDRSVLASYEWNPDGTMENPNAGVATGLEHVDVLGAYLYRLSIEWRKFTVEVKSEVKEYLGDFFDDLPFVKQTDFGSVRAG